MKFIVQDEVFKKLDGACFGIVIARGIDNKKQIEEVNTLLLNNIKQIQEKFANKKMKEQKEIIIYRDAFKNLGVNPNKFMSSIEALTSRIVKGGGFPRINNIVDIVNAMSLKYIIPMGAHDIDKFSDDIELRFSKKGDLFIPFGSEVSEPVDEGELIYVSDNHVKTRKWIWRQSEEGKIDQASKNIFFPIDGFENGNYEAVIAARDELAQILKELFYCEISTGLVNKDNMEFELI